MTDRKEMIMVSLNECYYAKPESFSCAQPLLGRVVYIHPDGRFVCLKFQEGNESFRECFTEKQLTKEKKKDTATSKAKPPTEYPSRIPTEMEMSREERLDYVVSQLRKYGKEADISISDLNFLTAAIIAPHAPSDVWDAAHCWLQNKAALIERHLSLHHMQIHDHP